MLSILRGDGAAYRAVTDATIHSIPRVLVRQVQRHLVRLSSSYVSERNWQYNTGSGCQVWGGERRRSEIVARQPCKRRMTLDPVAHPCVNMAWNDQE